MCSIGLKRLRNMWFRRRDNMTFLVLLKTVQFIWKLRLVSSILYYMQSLVFAGVDKGMLILIFFFYVIIYKKRKLFHVYQI